MFKNINKIKSYVCVFKHKKIGLKMIGIEK
uniref:Uncharacterized protein n=1 Tax=Phage sp. ctGns7 TaxID=2828003 RepID=A0A8S5S9T8_9VIRU|nr:MAG TPA: hypothetical protein [Phage sp. ctGns7]